MVTNNKLTAGRVHEILMDCLYREGEDTLNHIPVEGITVRVGLHPERVNDHKVEIAQLLEELPEDFTKGWSFLQACYDKHGNHWGEHESMEELFVLGMAAGFVTMPLSRNMWRILPGGMPYFIVNTTPEVPSEPVTPVYDIEENNQAENKTKESKMLKCKDTSSTELNSHKADDDTNLLNTVIPVMVMGAVMNDSNSDCVQHHDSGSNTDSSPSIYDGGSSFDSSSSGSDFSGGGGDF